MTPIEYQPHLLCAKKIRCSYGISLKKCTVLQHTTLCVEVWIDFLLSLWHAVDCWVSSLRRMFSATWQSSRTRTQPQYDFTRIMVYNSIFTCMLNRRAGFHCCHHSFVTESSLWTIFFSFMLVIVLQYSISCQITGMYKQQA